MPRFKTLFVSLTAAALLAGLVGCQAAIDLVDDTASQLEQSAPAAGTSSAEATEVTVLRTVDGDTIAVSPTESLPATNDAGTEHVVRLLGIDTPEMNKMSQDPAECGAQVATDFVSALVDGQTVTLTFDSRSDHSDRYGRSLAYVELDGADVAQRVIEAGLAEAWYPYGEPEPERFASYSAAQDVAAAAGAGSHGTCDSIGR